MRLFDSFGLTIRKGPHLPLVAFMACKVSEEGGQYKNLILGRFVRSFWGMSMAWKVPALDHRTPCYSVGVWIYFQQ